MSANFTESNYENAILQLFQEQLGYIHIYGPDVTRDYRSPLYEDVLLPCLRRVNPALPMDALNEAAYKLKNFESGTLLQKNMVFTDYLQNGVPVKFFVNGEERSTLVYLVARPSGPEREPSPPGRPTCGLSRTAVSAPTS